MLPSPRYLKNAFKQGLTITILLGVTPLTLALFLDIYDIFLNKNNGLMHFNAMMVSLIPSNNMYVHFLLWLSVIYCLPMSILVLAERELNIQITIPNWIRRLILNFECALLAVFSVMFIASAIFFTTGIFFCFTSFGIAHGSGFICLGLFLFALTIFSLAAILEFKDLFERKNFKTI